MKKKPGDASPATTAAVSGAIVTTGAGWCGVHHRRDRRGRVPDN
jgi:hypothetical protein